MPLVTRPIQPFHRTPYLCRNYTTKKAKETPPSIAIIGGGPSGLVLARLLEVNGITDYVVFERDQSSTPGPNEQGGTLDLHGDSGQEALKRAGLFDKFSNELARWDAACFHLLDLTGETIANFSDVGNRPEIDRLQLRRLLLESIPQHKIRWGHGVKCVEKGEPKKETVDDNGYIIHFTDGSSATGFRLVVGADGVWSKVRPLLTPAKPEYSGKLYIEGKISHNNPSYAVAHELVGPGNMLVLGDNKTIAVQQLSDGHYRVYFGLVAPEDFYQRKSSIDADPSKTTEETRSRLLSSNEFFAHWTPRVKGFVENAEGPFRPWPLYFIDPETVGWDRSVAPGVTLLGDAAHASTPFVGEGVNCSMYDAVMLAECLVAHCGRNTTLTNVEEVKLEAALAAYEEDMFTRGQDLIRRSDESGRMLFSDNAGSLTFQIFNGDAEHETVKSEIHEKQ
ncbi:Monooxygenase FAD-binding [Penicillium concentricum]|uniref:Monooxygenase FAD-binding n=1 Tax=Penicillium concentricum TaxID=293559 RepID=A0A9W9SRB4_9EURO|nr:Monooxygenase FAD-binding [Penicillium concentricum]KAJ5383251.1 Monooxygenase FAD-binding [Penicillium concentricum]